MTSTILILFFRGADTGGILRDYLGRALSRLIATGVEGAFEEAADELVPSNGDGNASRHAVQEKLRQAGFLVGYALLHLNSLPPR